MTEQRRAKAGAILKELRGILGDVMVIKDGEAEEWSSLTSAFDVELLAEAEGHLSQAIEALKEVVI